MSHPPDAERTRSAKLAVECLEDRTTPVFATNPFGSNFSINGAITPVGGGLSIASGDLLPDPTDTPTAALSEYVTGSGPGSEGVVRVFGNSGNQQVAAFVPFRGFTGGINVAVGDVIGDRRLEIVVAVAGNGPPHVKVFSPVGTELSSFYAFDPRFRGGVNIAVGNVLGGIRAGGFSGGLVSGQFKQEIIIGAAAGIAPHVVVTNASGTYLRSFFAFGSAYRGGVTVASSNVDKTRVAGFTFNAGKSDTNAYEEIVVGAATNIPHVKVFNAWQVGGIQLVASYMAFDPSLGRGVNVAAGSTDNAPGAEIFVALNGTSTVRVFDGATSRLLGERALFPTNYTRQINMTVGALIPLGVTVPTNPTATVGTAYDPRDDDTIGVGVGDYDFLDFAAVTGDGPLFQVPRLFIGLLNSPAPFNGP